VAMKMNPLPQGNRTGFSGGEITGRRIKPERRHATQSQIPMEYGIPSTDRQAEMPIAITSGAITSGCHLARTPLHCLALPCGRACVRFDLIDNVVERSPDRIVAVKGVTSAEEYLGDHF